MQTLLDQNLNSIIFGYEDKIERAKRTTAILTRLLQSGAIDKEELLFLMTKLKN